VRLSQVGGFGGGFLGVVPASHIDVCPPERGQAQGAGALHAGCLQPLHGFLQQAGPVYRDQALPLGRGEGAGIWAGTVADCCAQVWAVSHRGQQQRGLRLLGQGGEPGAEHGAQPVSHRAVARQPSGG
jgi:hypothetical protein